MAAARDRPDARPGPGARCPWGLWIGLGLGLVALHVALLGLASKFARAVPPAEQPIGWAVALGMAAGGLFLLVPRRRTSGAPGAGGARLLLWIVAVGLALRGLMMAAPPILEADYERYLWDGAVSAHGFNPYRLSPLEVLEQAGAKGAEGGGVAALAAAPGSNLAVVGYPGLATVYPPVAQAFFALAHWIAPFDLLAWRGVLLAGEIATAALLARLLARLALPPAWLALYWWNPIAVKEVMNSAHMDGLLLPFLLGALLFAVERRHLRAATALAFAVGVKVWPLLLLPLILRPLLDTPRRLLGALGLFAGASVALYLPVFAAGFGAHSGFVAYARLWEMNDAVFAALIAALEHAGAWAGAGALDAQAPLRLALSLGLGAFALAISRRPAPDGRALVERALWIGAALFLLGPTGFPWYFLWFAPLLALRPRLSLLALAALLPLYDLRFAFSAAGDPGPFDRWIVWLEFGPPLALLAWEGWRSRRAGRAGPAGAPEAGR